MKRIITFAVAVVSTIASFAQTDVDSTAVAQASRLQDQAAQLQDDSRQAAIWGRARYTNIGYAITDFANEDESPSRCKWSFFITKGACYNFPSHALGGVVKFGVDARWFDVQLSKLKSFDQSEWSSVIDRTGGYDDEYSLPDIGGYFLTLGVGIGPRVTVAPFSSLDSKARFLKASLYFHYRPTLAAYFKSENDESDAACGFCNMMDFGGSISYRAVAIGIEGSWGSGKLKSLDFDDEGDSSVKIKRKLASTRLYISIAF
jgi:hypothetical protein